MQILQLTLAIIKPHVIKNPVALAYVRHVLKSKFIVIKTKRMMFDHKLICNFYKEHEKKFFYNRLITFMMSGCVDAHILAHTEGAAAWRRELGPTRAPHAAEDAPQSLRALWALSDTRNVAHGADPASVSRELALLFPEWSSDEWRHTEPRYRLAPLRFLESAFRHQPAPIMTRS